MDLLVSVRRTKQAIVRTSSGSASTAPPYITNGGQQRAAGVARSGWEGIYIYIYIYIFIYNEALPSRSRIGDCICGEVGTDIFS